MKKQLGRATAVGLIGVGIWLASFLWKGPGLGESGSESPSRSRARVQTTSSSSASSRLPEVDAPAPQEMLTIVIHDAKYRLAPGEDLRAGVDVSLEEIQRDAKNLAGNEDGIRVRVYKERSAQEGARADLFAALSEVGVKREAIQERTEFVD